MLKKPRLIILLAAGILPPSLAGGPAWASAGGIPGIDPALIIWASLAILSLGAAAGLSFLLWKRRRPAALVNRARIALERQNHTKAQRLFTRVIRRLRKKAELTGQEQGLLQQAHLKLAYIYEAQNKPQEAAMHYVAAHEAGLELRQFPPYGLISLAQALAQVPDTSDRALEVYLAYLGLKTRPLNRQVTEILEKLGTCPEVDPGGPQVDPSRLARVVRIARRMVQADPQRLWPHLSLGMAAALSRDFDGAVPHLVQALRLAPDLPSAYYWLGQALAARTEPYPAGTRQAFIKFLSLSRSAAENRKRAETAYYLGSGWPSGYAFSWIVPPTLGAEEAAGFDEAAHWLARAVAEGRTDAETYYLLAVAHFLRGRLTEATLALVHAVAGSPQHFPYHFALAAVYLASGRRQEAEREFLEVLRLAPGDQETRRSLLHFYLEDNRWPEVAEQCRALMEQAGPTLETLGTLVVSLSRQEKFGEAAALAPDLRPFASEEQALLVVFLMARALSHNLNFAEALVWYDLVLELGESPEPWYYRACALGRLGRIDEALEAFRVLTASDNDYRAEAYLQWGHLLFLREGYEEAIAAYQQALELKPGEAEIYYALGAATYHQGQASEAIGYFSQCLEVAPGHIGSLLGAGLAWERQGDPEAARQDYQKVIELDPQNHTALERLAILTCQAGDFRQSLNHFMRLEEQALKGEQSLYHLGHTLMQNDEPAMALKIWSRLAARRPDDQELQELLARCRYLLGRRLIESGHEAAAAELWDQYLVVFPGDDDTRRAQAEVLWRLALGRLQEGDQGRAEAQALLQRAIGLDESHWKYPFFLAQVFWSAQRWAEAEGVLRQLAERFPGQARIQYHLGLVSRLLGRDDKALAAWQAAVRSEARDPYAAYALLALANESAARGDYSQAADFLAAGWNLKSPGAAEEQRA
ncbi:MAG: tetratricopeptide repeat protein [Deltaproteobacteria bacterium]|nr:MAG: tetratricopeptide repeat protein [Deltaproteobacteria bacterium]